MVRSKINSHRTLVSYTGALPWKSTQLVREPMRDAYQLFDSSLSLAPTRASRCFVFPDYIIQAEEFIQQVSQLSADAEELTFHIYGDFVQLLPEWLRVFEVTQGRRVRLIVASDAQRNLVASILGEANRRNIAVAPLPVPNPKLRLEKDVRSLRRRIGLGSNDTLMTYVGRISPEKNVNLLIDFFARFSRRNSEGQRLKLAIAGAFDDFAPFTTSRPGRLGEHFYLFNEQLKKKISAEIRERIFFLGHLGQEPVFDLLSITDVFSSLSTVHYEDFGVAPVQALIQGCPIVISEWGGFRDLRCADDTSEASVGFVPVRFGARRLELSYVGFENELKRALAVQQDRATRRQRGDFFADRFSVESVARCYETIFANEAYPLSGGFRQLKSLAKQAMEMRTHGLGVFAGKKVCDEGYQKVFRSYVRSTNDERKR